MTERPKVREFFPTGSLYEALIRDGGRSKAEALRGAEASLKRIRPTLAASILTEITALVTQLKNPVSMQTESGQRDAIAQSSERLIDVAQTLGLPSIARIARSLSLACDRIEHGHPVDDTTFRVHLEALQIASRSDATHRLPKLRDEFRRLSQWAAERT